MTTKAAILSAIRAHCLNCCGGSTTDVKNCSSGPDAAPYSTCVLWPYRFGVDPMPSQARKDSAKRLNNAKKPEGSVNTPNNKIQTTTQKKSPSTGRNFNDERGSGESKYEFWGRFQ